MSCPITVEDADNGGKEVSVYGAVPCYYTFDPIPGRPNWLREGDGRCEGDKNENERNLEVSFGLAVRRLQELGFGVEHRPTRRFLPRSAA